jgi:hypothetical protein
MTPKEKCDELFDKYIKMFYGELSLIPSKNKAKKCALIAVDEIINHCSQVEPFLGVDYWNEVRKEIEKL